MFNWFWRFLYSISSILFQIIDGMMAIANMLCGIEPITVDSTKTDFLSYLLNHDKVMYGFIGSVFVGIFLIMVFTIFAMLKSMKGKSELTPGMVAVNVFKTLGIFLFVPFVMIAFSMIVNELMIILYKATSMGSESMGDFLFKAFLPSGLDPEGAIVDYTDVYGVTSFMELKGYDLDDYRFFFSWICCIPLLFAIAKALINFVDRTISIVLLFIASPLSISTSIIDDGAHFKLWRDQVLIKFLTGYGIIIGLNVYILIVSIISSSSVVFFENDFLNFLLKIAFCLGGAFSLERVTALVGNLVSAGAGSNELRDATAAYSTMNAVAAGVVGGTIGRLGKSKGSNKDKDAAKKKGDATDSEGSGGSQNSDSVDGGKAVGDQVMNAIVGGKDGGDTTNGNDTTHGQPVDSDAARLADFGTQNTNSAEDKEKKNQVYKALFGMDTADEDEK